MKKLFILTTLLLISLTGCDKVEANEVTEMETNIQVEETVSEGNEDDWMYTEEYVEELKMEAIALVEADWESEGIPNEECRDEIIELFKSIEYDESFEYGYDLDSLERAFVDILVKYNVLPQECAGHNFDELEAVESLEEL